MRMGGGKDLSNYSKINSHMVQGRCTTEMAVEIGKVAALTQENCTEMGSFFYIWG